MLILRQPLFLLLLLILAKEKVASEYEEDDGSESIEIEPESPPIIEETPVEEIPYTTPRPLGNYYLAEHFDDREAFSKRWVRSEAKKDDADDSIAKYNGKWEIESAERNGLSGDLGLALKSKAHHHAISARLDKPFLFDNKPFIIQYEVLFQNGQECGGAYLKLLSDSNLDLKTLHDKTPYTIMFGPDKCGTDNKLHFIFRHKNPRTNQFEEKHWKRAASVPKLDDVFKDKKPHLFTLVINPDNTFEVLLDKKSVQKGSLLEDFSPPVNPPAEIDDPKDKKPEDWDEREKIPDPTATKPDDWDEDAPRQIPDPTSQKPAGWLDDEPELIPDPNAEKPKDWDDEMDGEWEAPLISNPKCEAVGCGEWKPAMKDNPAYKGKWRPPLIDNPNYKGKWKPKKIPNPDFFEDLHPYKMTPIGAVGFELWSMSDGILFDNIIITDDLFVAEQWALETWALKKELADRETDNVLMRLVKYTNKHPWLWAVYIVVIALPVVLFISFCCTTKETEDQSYRHKKTDEVTPEDVPPTVKDQTVKDEVLPSHAEVEEPEEAEEEEEEESSPPPDTLEVNGSDEVEENEEKTEAEEKDEVEEEEPEKQPEGIDSAKPSEGAEETEKKVKNDDGASGDGKRGSPRKRPKPRID